MELCDGQIATCHSGRGFTYFSCYGNIILYNERVEIGGYTIQFYHKLKQPFRRYCHKDIGIFVYNPMGGGTPNGLPIHFQ